jgi:hypothetical protein
MADEPRPCPRRYCDGNLRVVESGVLNALAVKYWDCTDCDLSVRETDTGHDEPTLDL